MNICFNGKKIGMLRPSDNTFITTRLTEKHFFRKFKGYGISSSILHKIKGLSCKKIIIIEELKNGMRRKLTTTIENYYEKSEHYRDLKADDQRILPLKYFTIS